MFTLDNAAKFLRIFSSIAFTVMCVIMVFIIWKGGWDSSLQSEQLKYLGISLLILIGLMGGSVFFTTKRFDSVSFDAKVVKGEMKDTDNE